MIKFSALISLAPYPEDMKKDFIAREGELTEDQKFQLSEVAWQALSTLYRAELQKRTNDMMLEMAKGGKTYSPNDFQEVKAKLYYEFAQKLEAAETEAGLAEVKQKLEAYKLPVVSPSTPKP